MKSFPLPRDKNDPGRAVSSRGFSYQESAAVFGICLLIADQVGNVGDDVLAVVTD